MMAVRAHTQGGPEVLMYEPAPRPTPGAGEVLVSVDAAAITFDELSWPETWAIGGVDRTPVIPSHEFSGVVVALGDGVAGLSVGDEVYGLVPFDRDGAAADYVNVPATNVATRPRTVSHVVAAAAVLPALTAWEASSTMRPCNRASASWCTAAPAVSAPSSSNWRPHWVHASRPPRTPPTWNTSSPWAPNA
jgi:NADPH:quinone reductase-like Zn-dependent oxidoreductase